MLLKRVFISLIMLMATASTHESDAHGDMEVSSASEGLSEFFLVVGDYYRVSQKEIIAIRERGIPPCEIPVLFFIAKRAHVAPEIVMVLRVRDDSWLHTTLRFGLGPEIFYFPMAGVVKDPPYGRVYGYYQHKPKKEWKAILLRDDDIINLVNLKLMSEHYGYPPEKIIKMRSEGKEFVLINDEIRKEKEKVTTSGRAGGLRIRESLKTD